MCAEVSRIPKELLPECNNCENRRKLLRFAFGNHDGRDSIMGDAIPIWADGISKPARVRIIRRKTELLSGIGIIEKMDSAVNFGGEIDSRLDRVSGE